MDVMLIAMDLDGTALRSDHKTFSPRLLAALEEAHRRGCVIAPVTGRQYGLLPDFLREHPVWESLAVLCNGGQIRELGTGKVLSRLDIASDALRQVHEMAKHYGLPVEYSVDSRLHLTRRDYEAQLPFENLRFHTGTILAKCGVIVESLQPLFEEKVEKINLLCIPQHLREMVEKELARTEVSAVWASSSSMEITHPEANKGQGIQTLCRLLDIPMEAVMALGDSGNDETMLRQAGLGVAMGNAPQNVKACADAVTETNENDGAAIAVERYVLAR